MGFWKSLFGTGSGSVEHVRTYSEAKMALGEERTYTYEVYRANTAQEAKDFLGKKSVPKMYFFIVVETPEGNWGKDYQGMYKE